MSKKEKTRVKGVGESENMGIELSPELEREEKSLSLDTNIDLEDRN